MNTKKVLIAGGSGTLGSALAGYLDDNGYDVHILSRQQNPDSAMHSYRWNPDTEFLEEGALEDTYALVNLTGTPLDAKRWTRKYKQAIHDSRIIPSQFLNREMRKLDNPPQVYIGGSGISIYGDTGDRWMAEDAPAGDLSRYIVWLSKEWEHAHLNNGPSGVRKIVLRQSPVLNTEAGFLPKLQFQARFGIFPSFGTGKQWQSWIHIDDLCHMIRFCMENDDLEGPYNATAPGVIRQRDFMKTLRMVMGNPGLLIPVPAIALQLILGEMSEVLFDNTRISSDAIRNAGFSFHFPELKEALEDLLEKA